MTPDPPTDPGAGVSASSQHVHIPGHSVLEAEIEQFEHEARRIAAGGWRRAATGFALGAAVGLAAAAAMRDGDVRVPGWASR